MRIIQSFPRNQAGVGFWRISGRFFYVEESSSLGGNVRDFERIGAAVKIILNDTVDVKSSIANEDLTKEINFNIS